MKQDTAWKKEFVVDAFGHFGNYFFAHGWQTVTPPDNCLINYHVPVSATPVMPEISYHYAGESSIAEHTNCPADLLRSVRFLHFFWVDDGYKIKVDASNPLPVSLRSEETGEAQFTVTLTSLLTVEHLNYFLATLGACGHREVWHSRLVTEMVAGLPTRKRRVFHQHRAAACGWKATEEAFLSDLAGAEPAESTEARISFYGAAVLRTPKEYLTADLTSRFEDSANMLTSRSPQATLFEAFNGLRRIDPASAYRFAPCRLACFPSSHGANAP